MLFYTAILETIDQEKDKEVAEIHEEHLKKYMNEGKIYAKGIFSDNSGAIILYNTESIEEAKSIMEEDPVIKEKSRRYQIKEWNSSLNI